MKVLFLFSNAPLDPAFGGGSSRYVNSYQALLDLGCEVHVLRLLEEGKRLERVREFEADAAAHQALRAKACSWTDLQFRARAGKGRVSFLWNSAVDPSRVAFPEMADLSRPVQKLISRIQPDLTWSEFGLCGAIMAKCAPKHPWVLAHHDWAHRLVGVRHRMAGRRPSWSDRLLESSMERAERWMARSCDAVVTGSSTEGKELAEIGCENFHVIPTCYEAVPPPPPGAAASVPARVIHLGALSTTSNHAGLKVYLEKIHPSLSTPRLVDSPISELMVVGDTSRAKPELLAQLTSAGVKLVGHVPDLSNILRPFDLAIIPYEENTGTRTKLSLLFNHSQVVVAMKAAVAGSTEIRPGRDCVVLDRVEDFAAVLLQLAADPKKREQIGRAARASFESHFTSQVQRPRFAKVLTSAGAGLPEFVNAC